MNDWGATRTFQASEGPRGGGGGGFGGAGGERRGGGFGSDRPQGASDGVDDWGSSRKFEPSAERPGGGGFRDAPRGDGPPRPSGGRAFEPSRADEGGDQWAKTFQPSEPPPGRAAGGARPGFGFGGDRPGGGSAAAAEEEDRWARRAMPPAAEPAVAAAAGERPKLKLAPRSKPLDDAAAPAPAATSGVADAAEKKPSSNPFGAARPREQVLLEKGIDVTKEEALPLPKQPVVEAVIRCDLPCRLVACKHGLMVASSVTFHAGCMHGWIDGCMGGCIRCYLPCRLVACMDGPLGPESVPK